MITAVKNTRVRSRFVSPENVFVRLFRKSAITAIGLLGKIGF